MTARKTPKLSSFLAMARAIRDGQTGQTACPLVPDVLNRFCNLREKDGFQLSMATARVVLDRLVRKNLAVYPVRTRVTLTPLGVSALRTAEEEWATMMRGAGPS